MVGSISEPSSAVVAMVEPEIAENTVPATIAITERRPGTRRISSANASIALSATPVWNSTSPIRTKNGIGVSENEVTDCTALRASWTRPCSPPRKISAPTMLMARNATATERPSPMIATRPPNRMRLASTQPMWLPDGRGFEPTRALVEHAGEAERELDSEQREHDGEGGEQPPLREHQILDGDRVQPQAFGHHRHAITHHHGAHDEADRVGENFHQPGDARRHQGEHEIDAHVLAAAQEPRRRE